MRTDGIQIANEIAEALAANKPVVALESTLITHGLPRPVNRQIAANAERVVREEGAIPATIAVLDGVPTVGISERQLDDLANRDGVIKASTRDLGPAIAAGKTAGTTVAATMKLAHRVGIRVFATGGIGGAHRGTEPFDISADLIELSRTPVLVVCAGGKSILDIPRTLEILETLGVPVIGYQTDVFPAFYVRSSGCSVSVRADEPAEVAAIFNAHVQFGSSGAILALPIEESLAIRAEEFDRLLNQAEADAKKNGISGGRLTPYLLSRLAELSGGRTLAANEALIVANARLAARVANVLSRERHPPSGNRAL
jgi:pseudouridine-5'-phosphate glycosidase